MAPTFASWRIPAPPELVSRFFKPAEPYRGSGMFDSWSQTFATTVQEPAANER